MESKNPSIQIDMLDDSNYHYWKIRIQHVLTLKDFENFLEEDPPSDSTELAAWTKKDKTAQAIIGLTLSNDLLENVREVNTTKDMCDAQSFWNQEKRLIGRLFSSLLLTS